MDMAFGFLDQADPISAVSTDLSLHP